MGLYDFEENTENKDDEIVFENNGVEFSEEQIQDESPVDENAYDNETGNVESRQADAVTDYYNTENDLNVPKRKKGKDKIVKVIIKDVVTFVVIILVAFIVAVLINIYVIRSSNVVGTSMYPTLQNGQSVLISRLPYIFSEPERGDIIVFDAKKNERTFFKDLGESIQNNAITKIFTDDKPAFEEEEFYIKRIVGIAGDTITVKDYVMYINGKPLANNGYTVNDDGTAFYGCEGMTWTVGEGYVFVLGDNRINSKDSRIMGLIPTDCIMGKVVKE